MTDGPFWTDDEESRADLDWHEHLEDSEIQARDRLMERGDPVPVAKCLVCGYHYRATTLDASGRCINEARCLRNQRVQRDVYGNRTGRAA